MATNDNPDSPLAPGLFQALELVLDHVSFGVFATEPGKDVILFANREFTGRFGDCAGLNATGFLDLPPAFFASLPGKAEETYSDSTAEWFSVIGSDLVWPDGSRTRLYTCRSTTAKKLLAQVRKDAAALRETFLAEARREISAPLKAIGGIADQIMEEYVTPQVRNHAFRIKHAAGSLAAAINDLINVRQAAPAAESRRQVCCEGDPLHGIAGLDVELGLENMSDSEKLYRQILAQYCSVAPVMDRQIRDSVERRDLPNLVIHLHSLKSSTASIGAVALSYRAARLEQAGRDADWTMLENELEPFFVDWAGLVGEIRKALQPASGTEILRRGGTKELLRVELTRLRTAVEGYDPNGADEILEKLKQNTWPAEIALALDDLSEDILLSNFEHALDLLAHLLATA